MDKWVFAFSGIESVWEDFALDFCHRHEDVFQSLFEKASGYAGEDVMQSLCKTGQSQTSEVANQVATFAYGLAVNELLIRNHIEPLAVAGFSLGVYAAVCAAGCVSVEDGLAMVVEADRLMREATLKESCGLTALVGLKEDELQALMTGDSMNSLVKANTLNETCHIYAGFKNDLEAFNGLAVKAGALTANLLPVDIPYHHPKLLATATQQFRTFLEGLAWKHAVVPVISTIDQRELRHPADLVEFVARNLSTPIHWQNVIEKLAEAGIDHLAECGPGLTLTRNGRFIPVQMQYVNVKNMQRRLGW